MAEKDQFSGTSAAGDFSQALSGAITAAHRALNTNFFTWNLDAVSGSVGGFVGAHDVTVTIRARSPGGKAKLAASENASSGPANWHAWHNRMPGSPPTLHVVGSETFPTTGYRVELKPAAVQGINPSIYLMEKVVHKPNGPVAQVVTEVPVHYQERTSAHYTAVQIMPDNIVIPVRDVF